MNDLERCKVLHARYNLLKKFAGLDFRNFLVLYDVVE